MLVLTLKPNKQWVRIELEGEGDGAENEYLCTVKILDIQRGRVKIGFDGDPDVIFIRSDAKKQERNSA